MPERRVYIGTSGWTYDDWTGRFYPNEIKGAERLAYYASQFDTVEVNATFYRSPTPQMIAAWNRRLGHKFHLVVKGSRGVTHLKKLQDGEDALRGFLERIVALHRLKVILWQLPPSLRKDLDRLHGFLSLLPASIRHAMEFRHESWWSDDVVQLLSRHRAAFVAVSRPRLPDTVIPTTDLLYVRFHGLGSAAWQYDYSDAELFLWASKIKPLLAERDLYAFFNNDYAANAVRNATAFRDMFSDWSG